MAGFFKRLFGRGDKAAELPAPPRPAAPEPQHLGSEEETFLATLVADLAEGKRRDEIRVPKGATRDVLEPMVMALESVSRALDGKPVSKFIVVPDRIVNIVCAN